MLVFIVIILKHIMTTTTTIIITVMAIKCLQEADAKMALNRQIYWGKSPRKNPEIKKAGMQAW